MTGSTAGASTWHPSGTFAYWARRPRSLPSEPDPADANHSHSRTIEFQPHHVQLAQVESQGAAGTLVVVRLTLAGRRLRPLKEPEPGSGLRAPAPRAREGARRHGDHPRPGGILRRAPEESWAAVVPWSRGGWRGAGPWPRRAPGAVSEVPARHRGDGSGKSEDLTNALPSRAPRPAWQRGPAAMWLSSFFRTYDFIVAIPAMGGGGGERGRGGGRRGHGHSGESSRA